ncbi:MAG: restriction endonuclease [Acidimicrobiia bacterium]|nr:restriction endonuclease [Acidimicrobiia bacterium]
MANPKAAIQDWLTLVDPDGAFLTTTELAAVFPHGFEPMPADKRTELRARVADLGTDAADRSDLRRWLLETALDWDDQLVDGQAIPATASIRAPEHGIQLRPDLVLLDVEDPNKARLGVFVWPLGTRLDRRTDITVSGDTWPASPIQRAETWCREGSIPLALVTDDDQWVLVWGPRGAPAASCRWRVGDLADERILQSGLVALFGARRFFAVADDETLEKLFERAANAEAEVTKGLGSSVRRSVELLVAAISRDDVASNGTVLDGVASTEVYESAVTVLMRLVFLLFAEERRLLPAEDPLWAESYSVLTLRDDLRTSSARDGEDALERRSTAWHRLLATFRAVHGGVNHDRLTLPAYGGSLFDPDRFPFLEGRRPPDHLVVNDIDLGPAPDAATGPELPVAIDDRTVLAILDALLTVEVKSGRTKVAQRVSYKALDVEQIGHCYEGLLDHGCAPVEQLAVGLIGSDGNEPEFTITELEAHLAIGPDSLCEWLADKTRCNKKATALEKLLDEEPSGVDLARLRVACGHDDGTVARVLPFWGLIRADLRGLPVVLLPGSQFVTQTSTRRNMGAQYTTKALAEEVVQYALEPLVYEPGPQNETDPTKWKLRTPAEIVRLRVCDPAVGSGAILTAAGRYLADRLVESVVEHGPGEGPFAGRLAELGEAPADEQTVLARREIVDHCLYGVDKNPVAAEMAKLSLWLTTMARERPFTFLDHAIQVGDALLGITDMEQLRWLHLDPAERRGKRGFESVAIDLRLDEAVELARRLQELSVVTVRDATEKQLLHEELQVTLGDLSVVADAIVGAALSTAGKSAGSLEQRLDSQMDRIRAALDDGRPYIERRAAIDVLRGVSTTWLRSDLPDEVPMPWERQCLHWPLAFPEVFLAEGRTGFDSIVGNPPFLGDAKITSTLGTSFREYLVERIAQTRGRADLIGFFVRRIRRLLGRAGAAGILATNTVAQGDTREVGLDYLVGTGSALYRAVKSENWPGEATLKVSKVWFRADGWNGKVLLEGREVAEITGYLDAGSRVSGVPNRLVGEGKRSFKGSDLGGNGFVLSEAEAHSLRATDERNSAVTFRYLNGEDLNSRADLSASRWVINFFDWPLEKAQSYSAPYAIVEARVRPYRLTVNRESHRKWWWHYGDKRPELYDVIQGYSRVLVIAQVSKTLQPAFVPTDQVLSAMLIVFAYDDDFHFGVLASNLHGIWVAKYASTLRSDLRYTPSDVFETFPQPGSNAVVDLAGRSLDEFRCDLMARTQLGLTKTYNQVHAPAEGAPDIVRLRELHIELDCAVRDAYGWTDLKLNHQHWETPQGMRFTVSPEAKDELLDRLLELNQERYASEVAAGLHDKKTKKVAAKRAMKAENPSQETLL